jgi:hypothetical protein
MRTEENEWKKTIQNMQSPRCRNVLKFNVHGSVHLGNICSIKGLNLTVVKV